MEESIQEASSSEEAAFLTEEVAFLPPVPSVACVHSRRDQAEEYSEGVEDSFQAWEVVVAYPWEEAPEAEVADSEEAAPSSSALVEAEEQVVGRQQTTDEVCQPVRVDFVLPAI